MSQKGPQSEVITIDGAKNPELIPQWAIWELTLTLMAKSKSVQDELPTDVLHTVSPEEAACIFKKADIWQANYRKCMDRVMAV